jgi:hypothetical protein
VAYVTGQDSRLSDIERWTLRPDGSYDGPMALYESVVREAAYIGASAGQAAFKTEVEALTDLLRKARLYIESHPGTAHLGRQLLAQIDALIDPSAFGGQ